MDLIFIYGVWMQVESSIFGVIVVVLLSIYPGNRFDFIFAIDQLLMYMKL